ncbi:cytochrome b/b6 domain-containing protein [Actibacterium sp. D379-3]
MRNVPVWDLLVRSFHWLLVAGFTADALFIEDETKLHQQIGYAVLVLIGTRAVWGVVGTRHARFADFPPSVSAALAQLRDIATGRRRIHLGHSPLGALMIYNLLGTIALIGLTGWMMTTDTFWGTEWVEEMHEGLVIWAGAGALVHVAAVIVESRRTGVNLPRAMVTGYKRVPQDDDWTES